MLFLHGAPMAKSMKQLRNDQRLSKLRFDEGLSGVNVFRLQPAASFNQVPGLPTYHVEAVVKYGEEPARWLTFHVCRYGREGRGEREALTISRESQDVFTVEHHRHHPEMPADSFLLTQIPESLVDG